MNPTLFELTTFKGSTVTQDDVPRLTSQLARVRKLMLDGKWRTLRQIADEAGPGSEASMSARLRDLRREGLTVEGKDMKKGLWIYRIV